MPTYLRILINWATDLIVSFSCEFISFTDVTSTLNTVWIILPRNQTLQKNSHEYINTLNNYLQSLQLGPFLESPGYKSTGNLRSGSPSFLLVSEGRGKKCLIHLLSVSSAHSPESGLLSDWLNNKRAHQAMHWLVTSKISDFRCN